MQDQIEEQHTVTKQNSSIIIYLKKFRLLICFSWGFLTWADQWGSSSNAFIWPLAMLGSTTTSVHTANTNNTSVTQQHYNIIPWTCCTQLKLSRCLIIVNCNSRMSNPKQLQLWKTTSYLIVELVKDMVYCCSLPIWQSYQYWFL